MNIYTCFDKERGKPVKHSRSWGRMCPAGWPGLVKGSSGCQGKPAALHVVRVLIATAQVGVGAALG